MGSAGKIWDGLHLTGIEQRPKLGDEKPLLAKVGKLYIPYLNHGGVIEVPKIPDTLNYRWITPER